MIKHLNPKTFLNFAQHAKKIGNKSFLYSNSYLSELEMVHNDKEYGFEDPITKFIFMKIVSK